MLLDNGRTNALADEVGPPGAALHPLLGLPERLPGLRAHRRPRLRLGLPRPDRRDPQPAAQGRRGATSRPTRCPTPRRLCGACFEVCPVRIDIPEVLVHLRGKVVDAHRERPAQGPGPRDAGRRHGSSATPRRTAVAERVAGLSSRLVSAVSRRSLPGGRTAIGRLPWPGAAVDRCPRPALAAPGVVPRLVAAHGRRPPRRRDEPVSARDEVLGRVRRALADVDRAHEEAPLAARTGVEGGLARRAGRPLRRAGGGLPRDGRPLHPRRGAGTRSRWPCPGRRACSSRTASRRSGWAPASRTAPTGSRTTG